MKNWRNFFVGKKITMLGLGVLGRGVNVARFLSKHGAILTITDLKSSTALAPSLKKLRNYKNIKFVLGKHELNDFKNADMVIKSAGVPLDSPYIKEARKNKIPVEMDASLFAKFSPATIIGITGTRGKSTVTHLIYHILKRAKKRVFLGGNVRGLATLPLLEKTKSGDIVVLELDSWQLQGFGDSKISPYISVFTTFLDDHLNYYKGSRKKYFADKANIFKYQKKSDMLIVGKGVSKLIKRKSIVPKPLPKEWNLKIPGEHNRENTAFALSVARALKVPEKIIRHAVERFVGVPGRLELIRTVRGIKIYNDTTATTPDATLVALRALGDKKNIILIAGGADKGLKMAQLVREISKYCKAVVLLAGSGTDRLKIRAEKFSDLSKAVKKAYKLAKSGDTILFSPAFASFGMFRNEYDRGEQFVKFVKKLK